MVLFYNGPFLVDLKLKQRDKRLKSGSWDLNATSLRYCLPEVTENTKSANRPKISQLM